MCVCVCVGSRYDVRHMRDDARNRAQRRGTARRSALLSIFYCGNAAPSRAIHGRTLHSECVLAQWLPVLRALHEH